MAKCYSQLATRCGSAALRFLALTAKWGESMALVDYMRQTAARIFFERPAKKQSMNQLAEALAASAQVLQTRADQAADTEANHQQLRHITGIERWGQSRLRTLLGETLQDD